MNKHNILFSPGALLDMREARSWYNLQQKGLGNRFVVDVRRTVVLIKLKALCVDLCGGFAAYSPDKC